MSLDSESFSRCCCLLIIVIFMLPQVEGLMRLMEGEHVGPFNLGNPGEFTMLELAKVKITHFHHTNKPKAMIIRLS